MLVDIGVVLRDISRRAGGVSLPQSGDLAHMIDEEIEKLGVVARVPRQNALRPILIRPHGPPDHFLEGFRAIDADQHAVAMGPLARLPALAKALRPPDPGSRAL